MAVQAGTAGASEVGLRSSPLTREDRLHRAMLAVSVLWAYSIIVDARYHAHEGFRIESFLIPEHLPLYGSWLLASAILVLFFVQSTRLGLPLGRRLPGALWISAAGAVGYAFAGVFDLVWHQAVGFELNLEVTWSPSHLLLVGAKALVLVGLLKYSAEGVARTRASRLSGTVLSFGAGVPLLIPIAGLLFWAQWTTWYTDPLTADYASGGALSSHLDAYNHLDYGSPTAEVAGTLGAIWNLAITVPFIVLALARWRVPPGSITFLIAFYVLIKVATVDTVLYLPALLGGAAVADVAWAWMLRRRMQDEPLAYVAVGTLLGFSQSVAYFTTVATVAGGVVWATSLWAGVIVIATVACALFSFVAVASPLQPAGNGMGLKPGRTDR